MGRIKRNNINYHIRVIFSQEIIFMIVFLKRKGGEIGELLLIAGRTMIKAGNCQEE